MVVRFVVLGASSGLRSLAAPSRMSRHLVTRAEHGVPAPVGGIAGWLARPAVRSALVVAAAGELVADKLPALPDRIDPGPLTGRAVMGAVSGAAIAEIEGGSRLLGGLAGALGAIVAAHVGFRVRRALTRDGRLPDIVVALCEDVVAIGLARAASRVAPATR